MSRILGIAVIISTILVALTLSRSDGQLPSQGKYKTLQERGKDLQESDIENPRTINPTRKASENKKQWLSDDLLDMEDMVFEPHDVNWWDYPWPDPEDNPPNPNPTNPRDWNQPGAIPFNYMKGCVLNCPTVVTDCGEIIRCTFGILAGVLVNVNVSGPIRSYKVNANNPGEGVMPTIDIIPSPNAESGSEIKVVASSKALKKGKEADGVCSASIKMLCECTCLGTSPTVFSAAETVDRGSTVNLWVESGGLACPPFVWSVSGTGFTLSRSQTDGDYVVNRLQAGITACGPATITVVDKCGVSATGTVRCNQGSDWVTKTTGVCEMSGSTGYISGTPGVDLRYIIISGNQRQIQDCDHSGACDNSSPCAGGSCGSNTFNTAWWDAYGLYAQGKCISNSISWGVCRTYDYPESCSPPSACESIRNQAFYYYEWECVP